MQSEESYGQTVGQSCAFGTDAPLGGWRCETSYRLNGFKGSATPQRLIEVEC